MMMTPARTRSGDFRFEIDWTATLGFRIDRSAETTHLREYNALVHLLYQLRKNGQVDVLRAFAKGRIPIAALKQAKRAKRLESDTLLADLALYQPLWHNADACPKRKDPAAEHGDACLGAVDRTLPSMGRSPETRRRYETSFVKLRQLAGEWLPANATVKDLEAVAWGELRQRWTVQVRKRTAAGKSKAARKAGFRVEERDASAADWNHLVRALSAFLTQVLGDVHHPTRRAILKRIRREEEVARKPKIRDVFWAIVRATPEHAQPCYVVLGATGMRLGEYLSCTKAHLRAADHAIDVPDGKTGAKTYLVDPEYWPWVERGIPSPLQENWMRKYYKRAVGALGRPELRLHDLRHLFAQVAKREGIPTADTQAALGQKTPGITRDYEMEEVQGSVARAVGQGLTKLRGA